MFKVKTERCKLKLKYGNYCNRSITTVFWGARKKELITLKIREDRVLGKCQVRTVEIIYSCFLVISRTIAT